MSENQQAPQANESENLGSLVYATDVVATIAGIAAYETKGIAGMSGGVVEGFAEMLGKKNLTKGVKAEITGNDASFDISIVVKYGMVIQDIARDIQKNVKNAVETMTGLNVAKVTVNVTGIEFEKETKAPVAAAPVEK